MSNYLDHESVSCLRQHMTAVVLSSDRPDVRVRELALSPSNVSVRGYRVLFFFLNSSSPLYIFLKVVQLSHVYSLGVICFE